jgi:hypothetical protein
MMNSALWIPSVGFTAMGEGGVVTTKTWNLLLVTKTLGYKIVSLFLTITKNTNHDFREANASKSVDFISVLREGGPGDSPGRSTLNSSL